MDRMLYVAMAGARQTLTAQTMNSHNLANASTTGFRQDLAAARSVPVFAAEGLPSRVYALAERAGIDLRPGPIASTGRDLDVALATEGFLAVRDAAGNEAYTRAGDLKLDVNGQLTTGAGHPVLGDAGPIAIPPAEAIEIAADGTVSIRPLGQSAATLAVIDRIRLVRPDPARLYKGNDGLLHLDAGVTAAPDAGVRLASGALEGANVNVPAALVQMIDLARQYETQVKLMSAAADNERATDRLIGLS